MRRKVLIGCALLLSLPLFFVLVATTTGALISAEHETTLSIALAQEQYAIWEVITDVENTATWNTMVERTELLEPVGGQRVWREYDPNGGSIAFREVVSEPNTRWVTEVFDAEAPYSGRWEFTLAEVNGKTRLTIHETGAIPNPFLRYIMRFIVGYEAYMRTYFESLAAHFGEEPMIEPAPAQ